MGRRFSSVRFLNGEPVGSSNSRAESKRLTLNYTDNIDYNDIKHLIKERTRKQNDPQSPTAAIPIPGQSSTSEPSSLFDNELFIVLQEQHTRIQLFVKSKLGEITRRLSHLHMQVAQFSKQHNVPVQTRISVKRMEKYSKVETDVLMAGEELQSLARFISVQRLGFRKLLKKYQKWTGSSVPGEKFRSEILSQESSFTNCDLIHLLTEYTNVLARVRAPFLAGLTWRPSELPKDCRSSRPNGTHLDHNLGENAIISRDFQPQVPKSVATKLHLVFESGSGVDVDNALATLPLGANGGRAAYWVHSDNLVQTHIYLLQHMRRWQSKDDLTSCPSSAQPSRRNSAHGSSNDTSIPVQDEIETIVCDDLTNFVQRQYTSTIADLEARSSVGQEDITTKIRCSSTGEAIVTIGVKISAAAISTPTSVGNRVKIKRKRVRQLFPSQDEPSPASSSSGRSQPLLAADTEQRDNIESVRQWLQSHQNVQPLVQLTCRRTRFVGLGNGLENGIWATFDQNVSMKRISLDDLNNSIANGNSGECRDTARFPHAVLEVRWEGRPGENLVKALDQSHLVSL